MDKKDCRSATHNAASESSCVKRTGFVPAQLSCFFTTTTTIDILCYIHTLTPRCSRVYYYQCFL